MKAKTATHVDDGKVRCRWCTRDPLYIRYHDREWGVPLKDPRALFELLCLEGAQAGLSWWTILSKRDNYRRAFHGFELSPSTAVAHQAVSTSRAALKRFLAPKPD